MATRNSFLSFCHILVISSVALSMISLIRIYHLFLFFWLLCLLFFSSLEKDLVTSIIIGLINLYSLFLSFFSLHIKLQPSLFTNGTAETKRPCTLMESNASQSQTALKKSRSESRPSCPPFKVLLYVPYFSLIKGEKKETQRIMQLIRINP